MKRTREGEPEDNDERKISRDGQSDNAPLPAPDSLTSLSYLLIHSTSSLLTAPLSLGTELEHLNSLQARVQHLEQKLEDTKRDRESISSGSEKQALRKKVKTARRKLQRATLKAKRALARH